VFDIVMFPDVALNPIPVPAVNVTSVPVELFNVYGDDAPLNERSVPPPPPVAAMVTVLPDRVAVMPEPALIVTVVPFVMVDVPAVPDAAKSQLFIPPAVLLTLMLLALVYVNDIFDPGLRYTGDPNCEVVLIAIDDPDCV
jgi:hypothetical protein